LYNKTNKRFSTIYVSHLKEAQRAEGLFGCEGTGLSSFQFLENILHPVSSPMTPV